MLRIQQIKLTLSESLDQLPDKIINKLHISSEDLLSWRIYRESLDARRAKDVHFTYCIDCRVKHEEQVLESTLRMSVACRSTIMHIRKRVSSA